MQLNPVEKILTVSSEHPDRKLFSLITGFGSWTTQNVGEEKAEVQLKLTELAQISRIEIANESTAWVDIRVYREGVPDVPLLSTICLQTRKESKQNENCKAERILEAENFNEDTRDQKFDYVKIICRQPFNRTVRFGLSRLKFYKDVSETDTKTKSSKGNLAAGCDEVELTIIDGKADESANKLIAATIKTASFRNVDREKRVVIPSFTEEDADQMTEELRPKATSSFLRGSFNPSSSKTSTPLPSRTSFIFAPRVSAADQETRAKKAAEMADQVIPGKSPKKITKNQQPCLAPSRDYIEGDKNTDHAGEVGLGILKDTFLKWKQHKALEQSDQTLKSHSSSSVRNLSLSPKPKRRLSENDVEERRRVPPPTVQRMDKILSRTPTRKTFKSKKNSSVANSTRARGVVSPFDVRINVHEKQRKITNLLERIFSSESDGETATTEFVSIQDESEVQNNDSQRGSIKRHLNENTCSETRESSMTEHVKYEHDTDDCSIVAKDSDSEIEVKTESSFTQEQSKVVEMIDLEEENDDRQNSSAQRVPTKRKANRNPPVNCEVESDSDLEVVGSQLMKGVVFALSGFKNPYRSSLRSMAISMGARYRPDWDDSCTHLICAFKNTPKYREVLRKNGKIVTAAWIATSHLKQTLADWKKYRLE